MILSRLTARAFGKLPEGMSLTLAPGLNLLLAPNEAGKTTLAKLVAGLFYGFGKRVGGAHPMAPWAGGGQGVEVGGAVEYALADGRCFLLRRHLMRSGEKLELSDDAGRALDLGGREPGQAHLGVDLGVFLTVSRVRLDDLRAAFSGEAKKDRDQARQGLLGYFFTEAATMGRLANPVPVREDWARRADALFSPDGRKGRADRDLRAELARAKEALAQAGEREQRAGEVRGRLAELERDLARAARERVAAREALKRAEADAARAGDLARRRALAEEAAGLAGQGLADEASEQRARELSRRAAEARAEAEKAKAAGAAAASEAERLCPGREPAGLEQAVNDLAGRAAGHQARLQDHGRRRDEHSRRGAELAGRWGLGPEALAGLDPELPRRLEGLRRAAQDAAAEAERSKADSRFLGPEPAPRSWALALGLGLLLVMLGVKAAIWSGVAGWPWWAGVLSWAGVAAGIGLGWWGWRGQKARQGHLAQAARLREAAEAARTLAELAGAELEKALAPLPEALRGLDAAGLAEARQQGAAQAAEAAELDRLADDLAGLGDALAAEAAGLGAPAGADLAGALEGLRGRAAKAREAAAEAERQGRRAGEQAEQAAGLERELADMLAGGGWGGMEGLKAARERARQLEGIRAALAEVDKRLGEVREGDSGLGPDGAEAARAAAATALAGAEDAHGALEAERGAAGRELDHLAQAGSAAEAKAELERLEARRLELAREHAVYMLAGELLERAMERYRLRAQPSLLRRAGEYLAEATAGSYSWLGSDLFAPGGKDEPDLAARRDSHAPERQARVLSRGTRDQLYLCLRLALADEITEGGEPLPLILDDPLVNFDDARLSGALDMLLRVAGRRQVLLLTCHGRQRDMLAGRDDVNFLEFA